MLFRDQHATVIERLTPEGYRRCEVYKAGDRVPSPAEGVAELDVGVLLEGLS